MTGFTLSQLARRAGVSARTVRYYIQRGLLAAPVFRGPDTQYDTAHLLGLQAVRALQDAYWPLDAIASVLKGKSEDQLRDIASGKLPSERSYAAPVRSAPAALARPERISRVSSSHGTRLALAEGLELWLADDASQSVKRLAEAIGELASLHDQQHEGVDND